MDKLFDLLPGNDALDDLPGIFGFFSKWLWRCGCLLATLVLVIVALLVFGVISFGEDAITTIIVFITMLVAVASLIRSSLGY
ncbi:MAG: hypothetical protein JXA10_14265 [Anaerolineae bacterium]|nr:hypothetical protein [Anaerolineae bacterium]